MKCKIGAASGVGSASSVAALGGSPGQGQCYVPLDDWNTCVPFRQFCSSTIGPCCGGAKCVDNLCSFAGRRLSNLDHEEGGERAIVVAAPADDAKEEGQSAHQLGGTAGSLKEEEEDEEEEEDLAAARCVDYGGTVPPAPGTCCTASVKACAAVNKCMPYSTEACQLQAW